MEAGQVRLRPILMTTLAMIFGMLPMAIGMGEGGETQAPMGRAVIGGVITSTLLTLVVVPVAYTYLDSLGKRAARWFKRGHEEEWWNSRRSKDRQLSHSVVPAQAGTVHRTVPAELPEPQRHIFGSFYGILHGFPLPRERRSGGIVLAPGPGLLRPPPPEQPRPSPPPFIFASCLRLAFSSALRFFPTPAAVSRTGN
jgi:hypothetical protein